MSIHKLIKYWLPVALWMFFMFWMSTGTFSSENTSQIIVPALNWIFPWIDPSDLDTIHLAIRKAAHVGEYLLLGLLLFRAYRGESPVIWKRRWAVYTIITIILYAMSDEFHQSFVSSRTASINDVGLDTVGGILSPVPLLLWARVLSRQKG